MQQELLKLVKVYYEMERGERIKNFQQSNIFYEQELKINITNRALKHIVESRKLDNYKVEEVESLVLGMYSILENKNYELVTNKKEENSFLFIELVSEKSKGVIIVAELFMEIESQEYYIKTGFYKPISKIKKLLNTKNSP